jgi:transcriptional regulator with XRE-family HTH domain
MTTTATTRPANRIDLRAVRLAADLTQAELARLFGCDRTTIARWESGARRLSDEHAERLIALLSQLRQAHDDRWEQLADEAMRDAVALGLRPSRKDRDARQRTRKGGS